MRRELQCLVRWNLPDNVTCGAVCYADHYTTTVIIQLESDISIGGLSDLIHLAHSRLQINPNRRSGSLPSLFGIIWRRLSARRIRWRRPPRVSVRPLRTIGARLPAHPGRAAYISLHD